MKRIMALALSALLLLGTLSACSTADYDGMGGYNVSTTHDGRVNGTNSRTGSMVGDAAEGLTDTLTGNTGTGSMNTARRTQSGASTGGTMTGIR